MGSGRCAWQLNSEESESELWKATGGRLISALPQKVCGTSVRVAGVMQDRDLTGEVRKLAQMVTVSTALGNLDMHAKNVSLLHEGDGSIRLAPAYDMVPLSKKFVVVELVKLSDDKLVQLSLLENLGAAVTRASILLASSSSSR